MSEVIAVAARDEGQENSPISDGEDATVIADGDAKCIWNGAEFGDGSRICADGTPYECHFSQWMKIPGSC